jgi:MarR family transcriptional regulator, 2-MHQ and catechol-resistance regulon repressor
MYMKNNIKNDNAHYEATEYIDNARRIPRVRSFFWLLRCADTLDKYASMEIGKKGDSRTGLAVLQILLKYPEGVSQQSIAKQIGRTKQLIVNAIDKLERKGYLMRSSLSTDRRVNYIYITEVGVEHINKVFVHTVAMCDKALSSLSDEEIEKLLPLIKQLTKGLWQRMKIQPPEKK